MLLIGNNEFINSHHIPSKTNKRLGNRIDDFAKYINNRVYNFLFMDKLLNNQKQHILNKRRISRFGEESSMKDEYLEIIWKEGEENIEFIKRKMLKDYSNYSLVGNYDIDPDVLDPEILELICLNLDKEE